MVQNVTFAPSVVVDHGELTGLGTGADHSYIDQDVTATGTPTFGITTLGDSSQLASSAAPTADADIANKKYVDDAGGATMHVGSYTGDGEAGGQEITGVGGTPKHLIIFENVADGASGDRWETTTNLIDNDPQGLAYTINQNGDVSMQDSAIMSLDADGFTVGTGGGSPNANAVTFEYVAYF